MLSYSNMSTSTLKKLATHELRELAKLDTPGRVHPSKAETFRAEHEGRLQQIDAVLRARELGEAM